MSKITHFILVLIAIVISGCNIKPTDTTIPIETATNSPIPPTTAPTLPEPTGQLVTDTRIGFTFNYPDDWVIVGRDTASFDAVAYAYTMQSIEPGIGGGGFPEGESKVDLFVNADETFASLDAVLERIQAQTSTQEFTRIATSEFFTLDNGWDALLIRGESRSDDYASIHVLINGYHVSVGYIGEERFMWQIANSLRLI